jgi:hypothetical protein
MGIAWLVASVALAGAPVRDPRAPPDWVSGESLEWPRHKYVLGVGSADDRATAEDRARAEIARVFSTRVVSTTTSFAAESSATRAGVTATAAEHLASDETRTSTEKLLAGVEIAARWEDRDARRVFALAVLDRRRAAAAVRGALEGLAARARPLEQRMRGADPVAAASAGVGLVRLAAAREPLLADLRVLEPGAEEGSAAFARVRAEAREAIGRLVVTAEAGGEGAEAVEAGMLEGLASLGIRARPSGEGPAPHLLATLKVSVEEPRADGAWYWARASYSVAVRSAATSEVVVRLDEAVREASTRPEEARRRAVAGAARDVRDRLPAALERWMEGG